MFREWRRWAGSTVAILASGPSMTAEDAELCGNRVRCITVNSTYRLAPWADVHYSSDADWWQENLPAMRVACMGEFWTGHPEEIADDVQICPYDRKARGLVTEPGRIAWGGNSGYCAIGLAYQFGAKRILLVGFDMQGDHWHEPHPESVRKQANFPMWLQRLGELAHDLRRSGVELINCSRETAISCIERRPLQEALC